MTVGLSPADIPGGADFTARVLRNRFNATILDRMATFGLHDWWLTAGCLAQTVWNIAANRSPDVDIDDYDLFYFDTDTRWDAEDAVIQKVADLFSDLPVRIEIRNQARVPIWYRAKFGFEYGPVTRARDGIDRFAYQTSAIGLRKIDDAYRLYAPFGLGAVLEGRVLPNPVLPIADVYRQKTARWRGIWPHLTILPWPEDLPDRRD
ncbi:nucleotidyltransferase family protein [Thalassospira sp. MA62]|nr:nucleotidyltransferase family protein [Thalassospira sp. MA62]